MIDEDYTVAKLKGHNCLIKFKDNEELTLCIPSFNDADPGDINTWFYDVEEYINGSDKVQYFPVSRMAIARDSIKYVKQI